MTGLRRCDSQQSSPSAAAAALCSAQPAAAAAGLALGFGDREAFTHLSAPDIATNMQHVKDAGGSIVRFEVTWAGSRRTSRRRWQPPPIPPGAGTGSRTSMRPSVQPPPPACGRCRSCCSRRPGRRARTGRASATTPRAGRWRPSPKYFRAFATALARRYSGRFADAAGAVLPRGRHWQAWNEPNLTNFLTPQWRRTRGTAKPRSPELYRKLLNAFYAGIKAVDPGDRVVTAGTAPYGDPRQGDPRMRPAQFWRELLCVQATRKGFARRCRSVTRFDIAAHHPYPIGPPRRKAVNRDDVSVPDLAKITRPLAAAVRFGNVSPRRAKPLWITEISWDSTPDPTGLTLDQQAQYLEGALYVLWRQGADAVLWWTLRDEAPDPSFDTTYQSGVFLRGASPAADTRKPSFTAFRFPFTAYRTNGVAQLWGKAPGTGTVTIEARAATRWTPAVTTTAGTNDVFSTRLRVGPERHCARAGRKTRA